LTRWALLASATLAATTVTGAAAAPPPLRARVSPPPVRLDVAGAWNATVTVARGKRPVAIAPQVTLQLGAQRRSVAATRTARRGVYRARIRLAFPGRWAYTVRLRGRVAARGTVAVRALVLPYDLALDAGGRIYVADGELGRIVRYDPATRSVSVVARGFREPTCVVVGLDGTVYATDIAAGRVVRIDASGAVRTLAEIPAAACVALHPSGSALAVGTLNSEVYRVDPIVGGVVRLPIPAEAPHGLDYDAAGNLFVASAHAILRVDGGSGAITTVAQVDCFKVHPAADGTLFALEGDPSGGRVLRVTSSGGVTPIVGNGGLGPVGDGGPATSAGLLPSDVALGLDGALLVTHASPFPAIRRVDLQSGRIDTFLRG
jgi:hypothetical protein